MNEAETIALATEGQEAAQRVLYEAYFEAAFRLAYLLLQDVYDAEEVVRKPYAFEVSTGEACMYFVAESEREKEEWINSVGKAIVRHSRCVLSEERVDYT